MITHARVPLIRIVDDDPTVAASLSFVLEVAGLKVKSFESAEEFLRYDDREEPGCLLLDVRMPGISGPELQLELKREAYDIPVVFLSAHGDIEMAVDCVHRGAVDFLVKPPHPEKLIEILERACERDAKIRELKAEALEVEAVWRRLTPSELEMAQLVAKGFSNKEISAMLDASEDAVRSRRAAVFEKLDVRSALEAAESVNTRARVQSELAALGVHCPSETSDSGASEGENR